LYAKLSQVVLLILALVRWSQRHALFFTGCDANIVEDVPLSFVTGIFGMNVKEINGSPLSVWTAAVALIIVTLLTAALLWLMTTLPDPAAPKQPSINGPNSRSRTFEDP
jgi:hypothetical protein